MAEPNSKFCEGWVEADGFRIRYKAAGEGPPLVHLHGAGGLRLTPAHELLCRKFRVLAFEMPGFGRPTTSAREPCLNSLQRWQRQWRNLALDRFNLMGTSFGGKTALWLALQQPERVLALVLEAPAAIRPQGNVTPTGTPEEIARRIYAHPERMPPVPMRDPLEAARTLLLVRRLRGPNRDPELEARLRDLATQTLVVFGTLDGVIPPDMGRIYKELMPNAHLVFVYDAGHAIAAERPEAFAEVVVDFLERTDAFVISRGRTVVLP